MHWWCAQTVCVAVCVHHFVPTSSISQVKGQGQGQKVKVTVQGQRSNTNTKPCDVVNFCVILSPNRPWCAHFCGFCLIFNHFVCPSVCFISAQVKFLCTCTHLVPKVFLFCGLVSIFPSLFAQTVHQSGQRSGRPGQGRRSKGQGQVKHQGHRVTWPQHDPHRSGLKWGDKKCLEMKICCQKRVISRPDLILLYTCMRQTCAPGRSDVFRFNMFIPISYGLHATCYFPVWTRLRHQKMVSRPKLLIENWHFSGKSTSRWTVARAIRICNQKWNPLRNDRSVTLMGFYSKTGHWGKIE